MSIRPSSAPATAALVRDLIGDDPVRSEAASARLVIAGARAVGPLLDMLPRAPAPGQAAILRTLEAIAPPRGLPAAIAALDAPDATVAIAAAGAVRPHLESNSADVAAAALSALTGIALDPARDDALRIAALGALANLEAPIVEALRARLEDEPSLRVRRAAGLDGPAQPEVEVAAAQLEAALRRRESDPRLLAKLIREAGGDVALSTLHELVLYMRERERALGQNEARIRWQEARGSAHAALAARGSRLALFDLREALTQAGPVPLEAFVAAAAAAGDASCLEALAGAWTRTDKASLRESIGDAFTAIASRERLTKRHAAVKRALALAPELAVRLEPRERRG